MEILVVLALIAVLAAIAVPIYTQSIHKAKETVLKENLFQVRDAIGKYYSDKGEYPNNLPALVEARYIRQMPFDPMTNASDKWEEVYSSDGSGITDIKSGSSERAGDGSAYSEW